MKKDALLEGKMASGELQWVINYLYKTKLKAERNFFMSTISFVFQKSSKLLYLCLKNKRGELLLSPMNGSGAELTDHLKCTCQAVNCKDISRKAGELFFGALNSDKSWLPRPVTDLKKTLKGVLVAYVSNRVSTVTHSSLGMCAIRRLYLASLTSRNQKYL